jgi:hypothetical protein
MGFPVVEIAVIAAHVIRAFKTGIFELYLVTAFSQPSMSLDFIMSIPHLEPPQPVPLKIIAGALNTLSMG